MYTTIAHDNTNTINNTHQQQHYSGLAVKKMINCGAGVVDADYRGNIGIVLFKVGPTDFEVDVGDRIAQLILEHISMAPAVKVWELNDTKRGIAGFGSTGVCALEGEGTSGPGHFGYASTL